MNTYYLRTRQGEMVIDSDVTNGGFGPIDRENLEEIVNAMLGGREDTLRKLRRELKAINEDHHYLTGMEKEGHIILNIKRLDREAISLKSKSRAKAKNKPVEDEIEVGTFN